MIRLYKLTAAAIICGLILTACGGGSNASSPPQTVSYTVTPSVGSGDGTISPAAPALVSSGTTATFTLGPGSGYTAGPVGGTCGGTLSGNTYTTVAVTANCTVVASFTDRNMALTFSYETQPAPDVTSESGVSDFLALLNQEGAKGYFYGGSWFYNVNGLTFVNDNSGRTYSYELLVQPGNMADFLTQANAEGAKGYHYEIGDFLFKSSTGPVNYVVYRKDYVVLGFWPPEVFYAYVADPATSSASDLLSQANQRGQAGYWLYPYLSHPGRLDADLPSAEARGFLLNSSGF